MSAASKIMWGSTRLELTLKDTAQSDARKPAQGSDVPRYSIADVPSLLISERLKDLVKSFSYGLFWGSKAVGSLPASLVQLSGFLGTAKCGLTLAGSGPNTADTATGVYEAITQCKVTRAALIALGNFCNDVKDVLEFASTFFVVNTVFIEAVKKVVPWATGLSASLNLTKDLEVLSTTQIGSAAETLCFFKMARDVSYLALSIILISCAAIGAAVSSSVIVACLTSATLWGLVSFIDEKLYDPMHQKQNWNAKALVAKLQDPEAAVSVSG